MDNDGAVINFQYACDCGAFGCFPPNNVSTKCPACGSKSFRVWENRTKEEPAKPEHGVEYWRLQAEKANKRADDAEIERDALRELHNEISISLEQRGYQSFANGDIGKVIDQMASDFGLQYFRANKAGAAIREIEAIVSEWENEKPGKATYQMLVYRIRDRIALWRGQ